MRKDKEAYLELKIINTREHAWSPGLLQDAWFAFTKVVDNNSKIEISDEEMDRIERLCDIDNGLTPLTTHRYFRRAMTNIFAIIDPYYKDEEE